MRGIVLLGSMVLLTACGGDSGSSATQPKVDLTPTSLSVTNGTSLTGVAGGTIDVVVHVSASRGEPSPGAQVAFSVTAGGGNVAPSSVATNTSGDARATWTLGKTIGANALSVAAGTLPAVAIAANGTAGPPASLIASNGTFTGLFGRASASVPSVTVFDANQNPVAGVTVTFATTTSSAVLTGATPATDVQGRAQLGSWILGDVATQTLTASAGTGIPSVTFNATATNPWSITNTSGITVASVAADEGALFGGAPLWSTTKLIIPPLLSVACSSSGIVLVQLFSSRLITQDGFVTYQFDSGTRESATWDEQSPSFNALYFHGSNAATKVFVSRLAAARLFNISFREYSTGTLYAPNFNMHGLAAVLPQALATCTGSNDVAPLDVERVAQSVSDILRWRTPR